jgi:hypothetical protein
VHPGQVLVDEVQAGHHLALGALSFQVVQGCPVRLTAVGWNAYGQVVLPSQ